MGTGGAEDAGADADAGCSVSVPCPPSTSVCATVTCETTTGMCVTTNIADGGAPWYATYETSDGRYVAIGPIEAQFYSELLARLGLDHNTLPDQWDRDRWPALRTAFAHAFKQRTRDEWTTLLANTDACFTPVLSLKEAAAHPQLAARSTYIEEAGVMQPAPAPRFSRTPASVKRPPSRRGEHSREVLRELEMTDAEINTLASRSVIAG